LLVDHDLHGAAHIAALHAFNRHDPGAAVRGDQVDLDVTITEHVDMGRLMVIDKDDKPQAVGPMDRDHGIK